MQGKHMPCLVILKDGYKIQEDAVVKIMNNLKESSKENRGALLDLIEKCLNPNHKFWNLSGDTKAFLRKYELYHSRKINS